MTAPTRSGGRINPADIAEVRERARIDEVIGEHVTLRSAGPGSAKGLCPFHEERSPSFHVTAAKGLYYCFGCGAGGDAIDFLMAMDHLTFSEAVEKLAGRVGLTLRYEGGGTSVQSDSGQRSALVAINTASAEYFTEQLHGEAAAIGRTFLAERGFEPESWLTFAVGYAPRSGLVPHLRNRGFSDADIVASGVAGRGDGRVYDRFRDRLVWPIRDVSGDVVGFGARRLSEDAGPKYLNTPETAVYKKHQVLYGLHEARRMIAKEQQAVVVEGYTDVMACHLAGVPTAVATCGTSFGAGHVKVLRRLLMDDTSARVVFTFDGDEAGRKAALRAYQEDQQFAANTLVAIAREGLDPCDLRLRYGDQAVRALVEDRVPLFEFVLRSALDGLDLRTAEGRAAGLRAVAPVIADIRDPTLRPEYVRQVAGWLGVEGDRVDDAVRRARTQRTHRPTASTPTGRAPTGSAQPGSRTSRSDDVAQRNRRSLEQRALQVLLQVPELVGEWWESVEASLFADDACRGVYSAIERAGVAGSGGPVWIRSVTDCCDDDQQRSGVRALVSLPLPSDPVTEQYAVGVIARLLDRGAADRAADLRAALGEPEAVADPSRQTALLADLMAIEDYRRMLRDFWAREE